ncbi:hypothetical protein BIY28_19780 [Brenneria goodwinii]|nr:hypothetical protein BIY28_19780 [Brenneria goodwinii]
MQEGGGTENPQELTWISGWGNEESQRACNLKDGGDFGDAEYGDYDDEPVFVCFIQISTGPEHRKTGSNKLTY